MFTSKILYLFFVYMTAFCVATKAQIANSLEVMQKDKLELSVMMKRTACFDGGCPVYNLEIQPDGKVIFEGIENTKIKGKTRDNLNREKMNQFADEIKLTNFFAFRDFYTKASGSCPIIFSDNPSVTLSVKFKDSKEKIVEHYLGCRESLKNSESANAFQQWRVFPQQLYKLENKIDEIVETKRWIGERK